MHPSRFQRSRHALLESSEVEAADSGPRFDAMCFGNFGLWKIDGLEVAHDPARLDIVLVR